VRNNDKNYTDDELSESEMRKMQSGLLNAINSFESQFKCTVPTDEIKSLKIARKKSEETR